MTPQTLESLSQRGNDGGKRLVTLAIFYGSQTGTAEHCAIGLAKEGTCGSGWTSPVHGPEEYDFESRPAAQRFFVMEMYGDEEPIDNAV